MARIRTIKPEVWTDEKFGPLDPLTKLVFIGLISQADDAGRILDSVRLIDGLLFAYDDSTSVRRSLDELSRTGMIQRGETRSGQRVIQITNWEAHQKIDRPNIDAALPPIAKPDKELEEFDEDSTNDRRSLDEDSSARSTTNDQRPTTNNASTTKTATQAQADPGGPDLTDPQREMLDVLHSHLTSVDPPSKRRKLEAQARMVLLGEDRKAWEDEAGDQVPEDQRPELFRLALGYHADETQDAFRSSVRYVVRLYSGPDPDEVDPSMSPADRKLVKSINDLRNLDLEASAI